MRRNILVLQSELSQLLANHLLFFLHIKERKRKPQQLEYAQEPINLRNKKGEKYKKKKKKKKKKERNNLENNFNL